MEPTSKKRPHGFQGHGSTLFIVTVVFFVIALFAVSVRCWIRRSRRQAFGLDDYLIVASLFFSLLLSIDVSVGVYVGYGAHQVSLTTEDRMNALKSFFACQILYKLLLNTTKASILALYHRIFTGVTFRRTVYVTAVIFIGYGIGSIVATIFICNPVARFWDRSLQGKCFSLEAFWYTNAAMNILGDLVILILPMRPVWKLHLGRNERLALMGIFGLGMFVTATSIVRMQELKPGSKATDQTYGTMSSTLWSVVEPNTGVLCACLPLLKVPIMAWFPKFFARRGTGAEQSFDSHGKRPSDYSTELSSLAFPSKSSSPNDASRVRPATAGRNKYPARNNTASSTAPSSGRHPWPFRSFGLFAFGGRTTTRSARNGVRWPRGGNAMHTRSGHSSDEELRVNVTRDINVQYEDKGEAHKMRRRDEEDGMETICL